ncbi:MAG TPA: zinc-dependent dehydrogenase [Desulfitobacteriaceae bacterium]|nr:zinc-dependent dehydrogenase [Desulfitobacteriaceae bacterium]
MKAAVLKGLEELILENRPIPECGQGEVLVQLGVCGICRTDMKCFSQGQRDLRLPRILGHEIAGTVAQIGSSVTSVSKGDRVQVAPGIPCGTCSYCLLGQDNLCNSMQIMGFHINGGFAEYVLVPASGVNNGVLQPIPEGLSFSEAALTEPLACCVNMQESLRVNKEDQLLIIGAGPLGILNAKLAKARGVRKIILLEEKEERLKKAANYEFDYLLDAHKRNMPEEIMRITKGGGADVVIPCCPGSEPFIQGINLLAKRGRLGFFSGLTGGSFPEKDLNLIHYKELFVSGAYGCSVGHNQEALSLIAEGIIAVKNMITRKISLAEILQGLEMVRNKTEMSVLIEY